MDYIVVTFIGFVVGVFFQAGIGVKIHAELQREFLKVAQAYHEELASAKAEIARLKSLV